MWFTYKTKLSKKNLLLPRVHCQNKQPERIKMTSYFELLDFSLTVKAATYIFISGRGLAISSAKQGKSGSIYNLVKNK